MNTPFGRGFQAGVLGSIPSAILGWLLGSSIAAISCGIRANALDIALQVAAFLAAVGFLLGFIPGALFDPGDRKVASNPHENQENMARRR